MVVAKENFRFTSGEESWVTRYESEFAPRNFCSNVPADPACTTTWARSISWQQGWLHDLALEPSFHLQVAYKANWHEIGGDAPQFAENPPA